MLTTGLLRLFEKGACHISTQKKIKMGGAKREYGADGSLRDGRCNAMATKSEVAPLLLKRASYPNSASQPDATDIGCIERSRLASARVPLIGTLCRKRRPEDKVDVYMSKQHEIAPPPLLCITVYYISRLDTIKYFPADAVY